MTANPPAHANDDGPPSTEFVRPVAASTPAARWLSAAPLQAGLVTGAFALVLYVSTLLRDVGLWDTAEFQAIGPVLGIAHPTGFPTYTLLAWLASVVLQPFGVPALRADLLSAICVVVAVASTAAVVTLLTHRAVLGIASGAALAVAPVTWSIALRADPHALHLALAAVILLVLVVWAERTRRGETADRWLLAAAILFGISLGNHALTLLLAPGIALFVLTVAPGILRRPRLILTCAAALALTTVAIYAYLPIRSAMNPPLDYANPQTWEGFRYLVFAEQFRGDFTSFPPLGDALDTVANETLRQLGLFAVLGAVGAVVAALTRPPLLLLLGAWFGVSWAFALGYQNADIGRYHLVPMLSVAVLAGLGAGGIWGALASGWRRWASPRSPAGASAGASVGTDGRRSTGLVAAGLAAVILLGPVLATVPERHGQLDRSGPADGRVWLDAVLPQLEPNAVVVSWWTYSTALWYAVYVDKARPDVLVIDDSTVVERGLGRAQNAINLYLPERPVYLIRLTGDLPEFQQEYKLVPLPGGLLTGNGAVYRVEGMLAGIGPDPNL